MPEIAELERKTNQQNSQEGVNVAKMDAKEFNKWMKKNVPWRSRAKMKINKILQPFHKRAFDKRKRELENLGLIVGGNDEISGEPHENAPLTKRDSRLGISVEYPMEFQSGGKNPIWETVTHNGVTGRVANMENNLKYQERIVQAYDKSWDGKRFGKIRRKLQEPKYIKQRRKHINQKKIDLAA